MTMTTTTDDQDARMALYRDSLDASAEEIRQRHERLLRDRDQAASTTQHVCREAFEIAELVGAVQHQVGPRRFHQWWRDHQMPEAWDRRYLKLTKTAARRDHPDQGQLRLIGILPTPNGTTIGQRKRTPNPFAWIKWAKKLGAHFTDEVIANMDDTDRMVTAKQLRPLKELIERLEAAPCPPKKESLTPPAHRRCFPS